MKQAVILAAGEGLRLWPFTLNKPKSMIFIAGKPIIRYVIESLAANGIRDIIIIVGHKREHILDYLGDGAIFGVNIRYVHQKQQLGTAHALAQAQECSDKEFLVISGSKLISPDTISMLVKAAPPAILVRLESEPSRYGVVSMVDDKLTGIVEKPVHSESNVINAGIYSFTSEIFDFIGSNLGIPDILNDMVRRDKKISVLESQSTWLDIVYPWDILNLNSLLLKQLNGEQSGIIESGVTIKGRVRIGKNSLIRSNSYIEGPVFIGEGCNIGPNSCILPSTSIADNVVINPCCEIRNSVVEDDVNIGSGSIVQDTVIDRGCLIGPQFSSCSEETEVHIGNEVKKIRMGAMIGEGCKIGNGVTCSAGVFAGNYCQIKSHKLISDKIPDRSVVV
jgi:UDP-N-acetylglucosamine diphosphorylase / glucose-1-phosphate thymidylyltransferase / UDP-N-acetylgalactosamine diphosphorylase / glucosamine-1-phosphate N-acetyltransferase / galactosamine-1-phosphate N-acetyltransferase